MVKRDQQKILQAEASKQMTPSSSSSCKKKYKGVRMRSWGSWVSEIRAPNQKTRIWLGSYSTPEAAARAYDAALLCLKGSSASLNFPNTSLDYIPDTIMSPKSIQRVAAAAAANCFPNNGISSGTTPPVSPTPSSLVSSPSMASSPSDQVDDVPLIQSLESISMMEPWYTFFDDLQSPKYIDQMFNLVPYDPPTVMDDFYEELSDIRLWSFP